MPKGSSLLSSSSSRQAPEEQWPTFKQMLHRLHRDGIYLHPDQLAEFLLAHGLPVDMYYVPQHLQEKAATINRHYQGDWARLSDAVEEQPWDGWFFESDC